jgi:hypothetical protein
MTLKHEAFNLAVWPIGVKEPTSLVVEGWTKNGLAICRSPFSARGWQLVWLNGFSVGAALIAYSSSKAKAIEAVDRLLMLDGIDWTQKIIDWDARKRIEVFVDKLKAEGLLF